MLNYNQIEIMSNFHKALSNPNRLIMINLIVQKPRTVEEIANTLKISEPLASNHLNKLRIMGFLKKKQESKYVHYHIKDKYFKELFQVSAKIAQQSQLND